MCHSFIHSFTSIQEHPARGEEHNDVLKKKSNESQLSDEQTDDVEARDDFWCMSGTIVIIVTFNRELDPRPE